MSRKGLKTKNEIVNAAKELFMQKGFSSVSMSDICDATGLSRGGLYRHFASTKDIFVALLTNDKRTWENSMMEAMQADLSAVKMLSYYLNQVYEESIQEGGRLSLAIYEYERSGQDKDAFLKKRYAYAIDMMEQLLQYGQKRGEFDDFDTHTEAEHLVIFTDGLKMAGAGVPLTPETIRRQLDHLQYKLERKQQQDEKGTGFSAN